MLNEDSLARSIRELMIDICAVMYRNGYRLVSVGAMMRLLGIDEQAAAKHDDEMFELNEDFERLLGLKKENLEQQETRSVPPGVTIH